MLTKLIDQSEINQSSSGVFLADRKPATSIAGKEEIKNKRMPKNTLKYF